MKANGTKAIVQKTVQKRENALSVRAGARVHASKMLADPTKKSRRLKERLKVLMSLHRLGLSGSVD
jgi:hypothetical protein